jgi:protein SCO1/2
VADEAASPHGVPGRRLLIGLLGLLVVAVGAGILLPALTCRAPEPELDDFGAVPKFSLVDERGEAFTDEALRGNVTIVSFIFTRCDSICPITTMKMQGIQEKTFDAADSIKLLSISIDPTYDTPPRLAEYAKRYKADAARWRFVTGPLEKIRALVEKTFMQNMQVEGVSPGGMPSIAHNGYFALVDKHGHMRKSYDSRDIQRLDELIRAARFLARTQKD